MGETLVIEIAAEELRQHFGGVHGLGIGLREIGGAVFIDHALHAARLLAIGAGAFELFYARGEPEHQHEVAARAAAEGSDMVGIDVVFRGISAEKTYGGFHILHRRRGTGCRGKAGNSR